MTQPRDLRLLKWLQRSELSVVQHKSSYQKNGTCPYGYLNCTNSDCDSRKTFTYTKTVSHLVLNSEGFIQKLHDMKLTTDDVLARDPVTLKNAFSYLFEYRLTIIPNDSSGQLYQKYSVEGEIKDNAEIPAKKPIKTYLEEERPKLFAKKLEVLVALFKAPSDDEKFTQVLLAKDKSLTPPLHYIFEKEPHPHSDALQHLFARIKQLQNIEYKKRIGMIQDDKHENIFHKVIKYGTHAYLQTWIDTFNPEVAREVWSDSVVETGFHHLFQSTFGSVSEKLKVMLKTYEDPAHALAIIERKNTKGQTALHSAAIHDKTRDGEYVNALRGVFKEAKSEEKKETERWAKALEHQDEKGNTPLHYICSNGNADAMVAALENLTPEQIKHLMMIRNKAHELPFHRICKYGNRLMLDRCVEVMDPWTLAKLTNDPETEKLLSQNNHAEKLTKQDLDFTSRTILYNCFEYFEKRQKKIGRPNYELRSKDFAVCINARAKGDQIDYEKASLFDAKSYGLFRGSAEYQEFRKLFYLVTKEDAMQFVKYLKDLQSRRNIVAEDLMVKINPEAGLDRVDSLPATVDSRSISMRQMSSS